MIIKKLTCNNNKKVKICKLYQFWKKDICGTGYDEKYWKGYLYGLRYKVFS